MKNPFKFIQEVKQETFRITWPTKKDTMMGAVMVFALASIAAIFFLMIRRPPRSTPSNSSAASDVYKRQPIAMSEKLNFAIREGGRTVGAGVVTKIIE